MDVVVAMLKPKPGQASQGYKPQLYEILLMDSKTPPGEAKPAKYLPMLPTLKSLDSEPRELVLTHVHKLTGIKGERALMIKWRKDGPQRASLSQTSLFFIPVSPNDKISPEQAQQGAGFFPLEYVIDALKNDTVFFPSATQTFLVHLQSWLFEKHQRPATVECLFWKRAEYRIHYTVNNPCFIPNTRIPELTSGSGLGSGAGPKTAHFPQEIVKTANEALAKMLSIEKCDTVVMNPLFGSGLPYKPKVNTFVINQHWPHIPNYEKISIPNNIGPRWQDRYPLHSFAAKGDQPEVDIRLKQNYDHSLLDSEGCAPIHYAARFGCINVVATLLSAGCSPNIQDGELSTALHVAARKGNVQLARCLLQRPDIDLEVRDKDGKRPIEVCLNVNNKSPNHWEVERLISEASKRPSNTVTVFLMDKTSLSVHLTSGNKTTVQQIHEQIMKMLNLPPVYADIFTLWIGSKSLGSLSQDCVTSLI
ncbi:krev interaction trapped protein 1 [Plakobranchus ocellatus]|uniref:Krev interaction trapped protein 1 n=1 Tax=Plakobranchus ocellatus TaxID=259542 RepID=A0AAV4B275_9GAST|nr:krev interaction trapped protein 1 [Plakobranchus ocellatus]